MGVFPGKLALQIMFLEVNHSQAKQIAEMARTLHPDEMQLNTPLRPCPLQPLSAAEMEVIESEFTGFLTVNVYTAERPEVTPLDVQATRYRRPQESHAIAD